MNLGSMKQQKIKITLATLFSDNKYRSLIRNKGAYTSVKTFVYSILIDTKLSKRLGHGNDQKIQT